MGIIPAYAGNTLLPGNRILTSEDHPRLCGEHVFFFCMLITSPGSSPLMRGTREVKKPHWHGIRIIPAYAGNTNLNPEKFCEDQDHPRLCGEHNYGNINLFGQDGSSPLMRGTLTFHFCFSDNCRIIPAYAGNTDSFHQHHLAFRDHPRLCGEHHCFLFLPFMVKGSSPLMRGTREKKEVSLLDLWIIPAYAGNTRTYKGLGGHVGIIPAYAGNTSTHERSLSCV